jgi:aminoglycoside/choline kinase family phosphotransferase
MNPHDNDDLAGEDCFLAWLRPLLPLPALRAAQAEGPAACDRLMRGATQSLLQWQINVDATRLATYDAEEVQRELQQFVDSCVQVEFGRQWNETQTKWWQHSCQMLIDNLSAQPKLAMHGDCAAGGAMLGPISHDLAALLRDADISWDEEQELDWAVRYWEQARRAGLPIDADFGEFWRQLEWTGLQRHLSQLGQCCRRKQADSQPQDAERIARLLAYSIKVSTRYVQLSPLTHLLQDLQGNLVETGFTMR